MRESGAGVKALRSTKVGSDWTSMLKLFCLAKDRSQLQLGWEEEAMLEMAGIKVMATWHPANQQWNQKDHSVVG